MSKLKAQLRQLSREVMTRPNLEVITVSVLKDTMRAYLKKWGDPVQVNADGELLYHGYRLRCIGSAAWRARNQKHQEQAEWLDSLPF